MKGVFFVQLQNYISNKFGKSVWINLINGAGISETQLYFSHQQYSEEEFFKLLGAAISVTKISFDRFLGDFGETLAPLFFQIYGPVINKDWKTLDVIERLEDFNQNILQSGDDKLNCGKFICKRIENRVDIRYSSPRKMCFFAVGLMKGFAKHYNEKIIIKHTQCIFENAPECHFQVVLSK